MSKLLKIAPLVLLCILIVAVPSVWAYWVQDCVSLCTTTGSQQLAKTASDGAGGAIVTWVDTRGGNSDIYVQRVDASGVPQWTPNGVAVCSAANEQLAPAIVSDGVGGAIVAWYDYRSGTSYDVYAQRVNASGAVQWTANGVALCVTAATDQRDPLLASDGAGGAIVAWYDNRTGTSYDIYAQRVTASGAAQWTVNGVALCAAAGDQTGPTPVSDGVGGAIVTWFDHRSATYDIYAQRVNASGAAQWTTDGVPLCTAASDQINPAITADGAGGAVVAWEDARGGAFDIYAQRVNASGGALWTANGVALCTAAGAQQFPAIVSDGAGGAVVAWDDFRSASSYDIYAQTVNASGAAQWTSNGAAVCTAAGDQRFPAITSDDAGGAVATWQDSRDGNNDVYAQRVNSSGTAQWAVNGIVLCAAPSNQIFPTVTGDGGGGAIAAWQDGRGGNDDIYAQSVDAGGRVGFLAPVIHSIRDVPDDQGGYVNLAWDASRADYFSGDITRYTIWRALSTSAALMMIEKGAALLSSPGQISSVEGPPQVRMELFGGRSFYWQLIDSHDAYFLKKYSKIVTTASDSISLASQYEYFQVIAHTSDPMTFFVSAPDSGRSVDNIAPGTPRALTGRQSYTPAGLGLMWDRNTEADLGHYAVYRGTSAGFVPGPSNLIASPTDNIAFDSTWSWTGGYFYKVSAIDVHRNESGFAFLAPDAVTGTDTPKAPEATYLAQNYPNPFNPMTRIAFGLSAPAHVSLRIYDAAGRLVRTLVEGDRPAGTYAELWDGRDASGRAAASGIYFYRLSAGAFESTKKMALLR